MKPETAERKYGDVAKAYPGQTKAQMEQSVRDAVHTAVTQHAGPRPEGSFKGKVVVDDGYNDISRMGAWTHVVREFVFFLGSALTVLG